LEIYAKPYAPKNPVVTMDEQPVQPGQSHVGVGLSALVLH